MYISLIWERINGVLVTPKTTWLRMKKESGYVLETLLFFFLICSLTGISSLLSGHDESWAPETIILLFAFLLLSVLMRTFSPKMRKVNWEGSMNLLVYSSYIALLAYGLSMIIGFRVILIPSGLVIGLVLFGTGIKQMLSLTWKECLLYSLYTFLTLGACLYWGRVFLSF